jgi:hypothetical protein
MAGTSRPDATAVADLARRAKLSPRKPPDAAIGKDPTGRYEGLPASGK